MPWMPRSLVAPHCGRLDCPGGRVTPPPRIPVSPRNVRGWLTCPPISNPPTRSPAHPSFIHSFIHPAAFLPVIDLHFLPLTLGLCSLLFVLVPDRFHSFQCCAYPHSFTAASSRRQSVSLLSTLVRLARSPRVQAKFRNQDTIVFIVRRETHAATLIHPKFTPHPPRPNTVAQDLPIRSTSSHAPNLVPTVLRPYSLSTAHVAQLQSSPTAFVTRLLTSQITLLFAYEPDSRILDRFPSSQAR